jgi:biotin transporter BioY
MSKIKSALRSVDVYILLIALLVAVSTGHVGRLFADREDGRQWAIGYVLALAIDGVLALALYESAVRSGVRRLFGLGVFAFACAVSGGFNWLYYRQNYPADPAWVSALLGFSAPFLAALVSVLRAIAHTERAEREQDERQAERQAERALELERYSLEQAERTRRVQIAEAEQTKRARAAARAEQAKAAALATAAANAPKSASGNGRPGRGERDAMAAALVLENPDIGPRELARTLGCAPSTAAGILGRVRG